LNYNGKRPYLNDLKVTYTPLLYANGPGFQNPVRNFNLTDSQTSNFLFFFSFLFKIKLKLKENKSYRQESAVFLSSETHGGEDVAIYSSGPMSHLFDGTFEQSYIAHALAYSACIGPFNSTNDQNCLLERGVSSSVTSIYIIMSYIFVKN
jgi:alkaline phosphatase